MQFSVVPLGSTVQGFSFRPNKIRAAELPDATVDKKKSAVQGGAAVVVTEEQIVGNIQAEPATCIHLSVCLSVCGLTSTAVSSKGTVSRHSRAHRAASH